MGAQCRALHLDEAKRVRDVSLMTQTPTSRRMHYRKRVTRWDSNHVHPCPIISCQDMTPA